MKIISMIGAAVTAGAVLFGSRQFFAIGHPATGSLWLFLAFAGAGVTAGTILWRRSWLRKNEHRVAEKEEGHRVRVDETIRSQWKTAITFLKLSGLRKRGNPLYVLPWYMVIGDSGSGKTAALHDAGVPSFAERTGGAGLSATTHCEWSFFEQAIVIDTAGRFASCTDPQRDKTEWHTLLDLLFTNRKKEPLNGLIVAVAADQLITKTMDVLRGEGQNIRKRIDELMRMVGSRLPVYLMVTKCDLIEGMSQLGENLTESGLKQALGCLNTETSADVMAFSG